MSDEDDQNTITVVPETPPQSDGESDVFNGDDSADADDIALYRNIRSPADYLILKADITAIATCVEEEKHLNYDVNKCYLMLISRKRSHSITPPPLFIKTDTAVEPVDSVKHLGVLLTSDLSWTEHISRICNKTRKLIGLMYR